MNETTEQIMRQLNQKKTHAETHEVGGGDEIDVTKLKNFGNFALKEDTDLLFGFSVSKITLTTGADGEITGIQEKNGSNILTNTSWTYNADGTINTVTEVIGTQTMVSTFHYVNGQLDPTNAITRSVT
jgi:hypothetical protein